MCRSASTSRRNPERSDQLNAALNGEGQTVELVTSRIPPAIADAQLPANYQAAKLALLECSRVDECQDWADKMAAMASYARQSEDEELGKMCRRIQARALELRRVAEANPSFAGWPAARNQ